MKNIYFFSDLHLGLPNNEKSLVREKLLVKVLDEIKEYASTIYFVGDIFDYWWEYKHVVPRGYIRFLGKIAELSDNGVEIHFFTGNHDVWIRSYLTDQCDVTVHKKELKTELFGKQFFIAHGDGLGNGDNGYKMLKKVFENKFLQWCWSRLHPNFTFYVAKLWSNSRRKKEKEYAFRGFENEILYKFSKEISEKEGYNYCIFGHRHFPLAVSLNEHSYHINLGDWIVNFTFGQFNQHGFQLLTYKSGKIEPYHTDLERIQKIDIF